MRSLECRIGLLNSHTHTHTHKQACVRAEAEVCGLCVWVHALQGRRLADCPSSPPYVRRRGEDESAVLLRGCRGRKQRVGRHRGGGGDR